MLPKLDAWEGIMGFESLLGNDRLKENLTRSLSRGRGGHFYLISGPAGSGKHTLARLLAAALMCTGGDRPCVLPLAIGEAVWVNSDSSTWQFVFPNVFDL